jgi:hypothetical protein
MGSLRGSIDESMTPVSELSSEAASEASEDDREGDEYLEGTAADIEHDADIDVVPTVPVITATVSNSTSSATSSSAALAFGPVGARAQVKGLPPPLPLLERAQTSLSQQNLPPKAGTGQKLGPSPKLSMKEVVPVEREALYDWLFVEEFVDDGAAVVETTVTALSISKMISCLCSTSTSRFSFSITDTCASRIQAKLKERRKRARSRRP